MYIRKTHNYQHVEKSPSQAVLNVLTTLLTMILWSCPCPMVMSMVLVHGAVHGAVYERTNITVVLLQYHGQLRLSGWFHNL